MSDCHPLQNPNDQPPEFQVPDTRYKLRVMSTMAEREVSNDGDGVEEG